MIALPKARAGNAALSGPGSGGVGAPPMAAPPVVTAHLGATPLPEVVVVPDPDRNGHWRVIISLPPLPPNAHAVTDPFPRVVLHRFAETAGNDGTAENGADDPTDDAAELCLLRAEVDLLKHAFRRHCIETG